MVSIGTLSLVAALLVSGPPAVAGVNERGGCDFNGDGFDDLMIGVPFDIVGDLAIGAVHVRPGGPAGVAAAGDQVWHRDRRGVLGVGGGIDAFGQVVDCGDFDRDGFDDLVAGVPDDDVGDTVDAGSIHVIYGSASGLTAAGDQLIHRGTPGMLGRPAPADRFGGALAVGDFDGDRFDDLAVGLPTNSRGQHNFAGAVQVIHGSRSGLVPADNQVIHRGTRGVRGRAGDFGLFGTSLAAGDFDRDGFDDLAIGVPGDDVATQNEAGAVHVIPGSANGLDVGPDQIWHRARRGIKAAATEGDNFGFSVAAGDFDNDGFDDLVVGVTGDTIRGAARAGSIHAIYGTRRGLRPRGDQVWHRGQAAIEGSAGAADHFGWSLSVGDFDGDRRDDVAVGAPFDEVSRRAAAGSVQALYGSRTGLTGAGNQLWHRASPGVASAPTRGDNFGWALGEGDYDGDGRDDLSIGVPFDQVGEHQRSGSVHTIYGVRSGLDAEGAQLWHRGRPGVNGAVAPEVQLGRGL